MQYLKNRNQSFWHIISGPIIWSLIIPLVITDLWVEIYHRICFPLYGLPCVKRRHYIQIDRHKLKYLNWVQKINCVYCGYANGAFNYWVKIAGVTERYWCGIRHKRNRDFIEPIHHQDFAKYNDEKDFIKKYK